MTRSRLSQTNSALRDAIEEIDVLVQFAFDDQDEMNENELEEENTQLRDMLSQIRDLAETALENDGEEID